MLFFSSETFLLLRPLHRVAALSALVSSSTALIDRQPPAETSAHTSSA
jgi:hypothetical protein